MLKSRTQKVLSVLSIEISRPQLTRLIEKRKISFVPFQNRSEGLLCADVDCTPLFVSGECWAKLDL